MFINKINHIVLQRKRAKGYQKPGMDFHAGYAIKKQKELWR